MFRNLMGTHRGAASQAATDTRPNPGDYELGSLESRAAARALLGESNRLLMVLRFHFSDSDEGEDVLLYTHHRERWKTRKGVRYEKKKTDDPIGHSAHLVGPDIFVPFGKGRQL